MKIKSMSQTFELSDLMINSYVYLMVNKSNNNLVRNYNTNTNCPNEAAYCFHKKVWSNFALRKRKICRASNTFSNGFQIVYLRFLCLHKLIPNFQFSILNVFFLPSLIIEIIFSLMEVHFYINTGKYYEF